jgi:hypothetical protein
MQALKPSRIVAKPHGWILSQQARFQSNMAVVSGAEPSRDGIVYAKIQFVEALRSAIETVLHTPQHPLCAQT